MSSSDGLGADMERFDLDPDTAERMLRGRLASADAPPAYRDVASLFEHVLTPTGRALPGEQAGVAMVIAAIHAKPPIASVPSGRKSVITKVKLAAAGLAGALSLTTGLAAANALPGAAQQVASDALAKVGVSVPGPNDHAGTHPDTRGKSSDHPAATTQSDDANGSQPTDNKGSDISNLAHTTDATGVDKGAAISTDASGGKSQAGQHGGSSANRNAATSPPATPNSGGTSTANTASDGHSATGTSTADQHSGPAATSGSDNATSHRP